MRGLLSNINLVSELLQSFRGIGLLTLSEAHIQSGGDQSVVYDIPSYSAVNRPRKTGKCKGVGVYHARF